MEFSTVIYAAFAVLVLFCAFLQFRVNFGNAKNSENLGAKNAEFQAFQKHFFIPYFLSLFSDWLQGPYVYKLYSSYGFVPSQIAFLYVVGFASSAIFGTFAGFLADRYGRKRSSIVFCMVYIFCCLTKISPNFYWLLVGRIMGGVATSLLFSTFESWYIHEHTIRHNFPQQWMAGTFSRATLCNALLAIVAGLTSNVLAETLGFGPLAPFLLAIPVLFLGMLAIALKWEENYGSEDNGYRMKGAACTDAVSLIFKNKQILILGTIQFLFESVMYMFVFVWTPILDSEGHTPLGMVFACFMVAMMIGSSVCQLTTSSSENLMRATLSIALASILTCVFATYSTEVKAVLAFVAFLLLEVSVGIYFPSVSYLRSQLIPESHRATIMNCFRLPMNAITCAGLLWMDEKKRVGHREIFIVCSLLLAVATAASLKLQHKPTVTSETTSEKITLIVETKEQARDNDLI